VRRRCGALPSRAPSSLRDAHPKSRNARAGRKQARRRRNDVLPSPSRPRACVRNAPHDDARDRARSEGAPLSQEDAALCDGGARVRQRDTSLRAVGRPLSFAGASFAPRLAAVRVGQPPERELDQALGDAVARVNRKELLPRLERFALSLGASPSEARSAPRPFKAYLQGRAPRPFQGSRRSFRLLLHPLRRIAQRHELMPRVAQLVDDRP